jgi:peroxiredoxin
MLRTRQLIPPLSLHVPDGRTVRAWDFKQKQNLVIAFLDADCALCADFLRQLAARAADLRERETVALAVFLAPPPAALTDSLLKEIIAGCDMSGYGARAYLGDNAFSARGLVCRGVFIADRYGELFAQWTLAAHNFPTFAEIFNSVDQIEMACEECSTPAWPAES